MSSFTEPLIVRVEQRERSGRGVYTVMEPFSYHVGEEESGIEIMVPQGFETDFASIPRLARLIISPSGLHAKASLIHDALYHGGCLLAGWQEAIISRRRADQVFLEAMQVLAVPRWRCWVIYFSVRLFGWIAWAGKL